MNYNFSDEVRKALGRAREEAFRLQHNYVGTEHVLLGLIHETEGVAAAVLNSLNADRDRIHEAVEEVVKPGKGSGLLCELPYTSRAKKVLELAMAEGRELGDSHVGTEHLLLGLLREEKGVAAQVLNAANVKTEEVRAELLLLRESGRAPQEAGVGGARAGGMKAGFRRRSATLEGGAVWFLQIDPESSAPIYEQIMGRLEAAVATGRLSVGERLPPVRDLAAELGIAPGTVARAYSSLEQGGVLVTEGARGTRVAGRGSAATNRAGRERTLIKVLRPVVVAAYHMGARASDLRRALEGAMDGIFPEATDEGS